MIVAGLPLMRTALPTMSAGAAEVALPDAVADDARPSRRPGVLSAAREVAAHRRRHAEHAQEVLGDVGAGVAPGLAVDGDVDGRPVQVGRHQLERLLRGQELLEVHRGDLAVDAEDGAGWSGR